MTPGGRASGGGGGGGRAPKGLKFILYKHSHVAYQLEGYED